MAAAALNQFEGFRKQFGCLVFGGVFDRHPKLKVVFVEAGLNWIPGVLQDADMLYASHAFGDFFPTLNWYPSEYWRKHCYATFMADPVGLELLHRIGGDRVMWSTDYPHNESTFGYTRTAAKRVLEKTDDATARRILGGTAMELFRMGE